MDWDSNRYLESYFAVPMLGAVLMMVNIRLAPEQIAYTLNHSGARVILANRDFLPLLDALHEQLPDLHTRILLDDEDGALPAGFATEYKAGLRAATPVTCFPDFDENTRATVFYTTGTTGLPKGCASATGNWCCIHWRPSPRWAVPPARGACIVTMSTCRSRPCSMCTPGACPMWPP